MRGLRHRDEEVNNRFENKSSMKKVGEDDSRTVKPSTRAAKPGRQKKFRIRPLEDVQTVVERTNMSPAST